MTRIHATRRDDAAPADLRATRSSLIALASVLTLSGCSIAIDNALDGRGTDGPDGPSGPSGTLDAWQACDIASNGDTVTRTYTIASLALPDTNDIGFNIDRHATQSGSDLAGCARVDYLPDGIDNSFVEFMATLGQTLTAIGIDIPGAIESDLASGDVVVQLSLHHWNGTSSDSCVGIDLAVSDHGHVNTTLHSSAELVSGVVRYVPFEGSTRITPRYYFDYAQLPDECEGGCAEHPLPITLQGVRARLVFGGGTDDMARLVTNVSPTNDNSTILGGYVRYPGTPASGAFEPGLVALCDALSFVPSVPISFPLFLDLDTSPSVGACTSRGNTLSADAFSIAFLVRSD